MPGMQLFLSHTSLRIPLYKLGPTNLCPSVVVQSVPGQSVGHIYDHIDVKRTRAQNHNCWIMYSGMRRLV